MAGRREPSWGDLKVGIVVVSVFTLASVVILLAGAKRGPFLPDVVTYYVDLDDAAGIRAGSPVEIGGIPAGKVANLEIVPAGAAPPSPGDTLLPITGADLERRDIRLELSIQERYRPWITPSARAQLASIGMGGERYVRITPGDVREAPLGTGSEILTVASIDWDIVLARLSRALNETREITALSDEIRVKLDAGAGSLGRLISEDAELRRRIDSMTAESESLLALIDTGPGVGGSWRSDSGLAQQIDGVAERLEALADSLDHGPGRDWAHREELDAALADLRVSVRDLDARLTEGRGTAGRLLHDEELWLQLSVLQARLKELVAAFAADPLGFVNIEVF
ncbi:MAG TPA: MlaD family protein [Gemmatimonadota bacterium]|nr:MlaD family protein [Gemmatimonadota bacterium]